MSILHPVLVDRKFGNAPQYEGSYIRPSSPYLQEYFIPLMQHVIERFDFDAIWLDGGVWLSETLCSCDYCRASFLKATGLDLSEDWPRPPALDWDVASWLPRIPPITQTWSLCDDGGDDETWRAGRCGA
ncbi:MAG: hypothetical protein GY759_00715 [Chloroflexi bacterium]|nr:hypothetical protein [Chloroflexota bacterium]